VHVAVHAHCLHVFAASVALFQKMVLLAFDLFLGVFALRCVLRACGELCSKVHMRAQLSHRKMNSKMARSDNGTKKQSKAKSEEQQQQHRSADEPIDDRGRIGAGWQFWPCTEPKHKSTRRQTHSEHR
jgi:hypothetical protein